jgi:pyruvate/2-oxoglutarate dehydrogenase complex dihydrolipoamide acyltransferase (E2) component
MTPFRMPMLGADMEAGTLIEWLKHPGDAVKRGDIIAVVDTQKGAIEIEVFEDGVIGQVLVQPGAEVPVGTPLAMIRSTGVPAAVPAAPVPAPKPVRASPSARQLARERGIDSSRASAASISRSFAARGPRARSRGRTSKPRRARRPVRQRSSRSLLPVIERPPCVPRSAPPWRDRSARSRTTTSRRRST